MRKEFTPTHLHGNTITPSVAMKTVKEHNMILHLPIMLSGYNMCIILDLIVHDTWIFFQQTLDSTTQGNTTQLQKAILNLIVCLQ